MVSFSELKFELINIDKSQTEKKKKIIFKKFLYTILDIYKYY